MIRGKTDERISLNSWRVFMALQSLAWGCLALPVSAIELQKPAPEELATRPASTSVFGLRELESEYEQKRRGIVASDDKQRYEKVSAFLSAMISDEVYENGRRRIITALVSNRMNESCSASFAKSVSRALIRHLAYSGDRAGLVEVISFDCPKLVELHTTIEFDLAANGDVSALCDAFDRCTNDTNRTMIVNALRRGFEPMGIASADDKEFVGECRRWLSAKNVEFEVNPEYGEGSIGDRIPLYVKRRSM